MYNQFLIRESAWAPLLCRRIKNVIMEEVVISINNTDHLFSVKRIVGPGKGTYGSKSRPCHSSSQSSTVRISVSD